MIRRSPGSLLLAFLALSLAVASSGQSVGRASEGSKASPPKEEGSHRVIVRFADPDGRRSDGDVLRARVQQLSARPGIAHARMLERVGMAIAECDSLEAEEELVRELEEDPEVELATPDTWVRFDGAAQPTYPRKEGEEPYQDMRKCSEQSGCAALGLAGMCCPATNGLMFACCDGSATPNRVAFRTFHGRYWVAEQNGDMSANGVNVGDWETFQIFDNADGTVSLRTHFGKYAGSDQRGGMSARSEFIGEAEKFELTHKDGTVSLKTSYGKYVVAEWDGRLRADRSEVGDWEKFGMKPLGSFSQRIPNDANFSLLWGMNEPKDRDIDAPEAWKIFTGEYSKGIVVGVIDTGIDYTHEDLRDNMWVNPNEIPGNGIDDDGNGFVDDVHGADFANNDGDPMDDQRHGTHCAGTIAGIGNNGIGVTGVAWHGVRLMALKFLTRAGTGKTSDAVRAIDYAIAHGARILSNSWGGGGSNAVLRMAIDKAAASGILFTAAAGNEHRDNDEDPHYPSNYPADNIVSVASTNRGRLSSFSCYGATTVDLAAPGSRIFSTVPNNAYKFLSGTSMATPHVTGLAALVWMYRPALSMMQVKEVLMGSVEHSDALEGKCVSGGMINARSALEVASKMEPPYPPVHAPQSVEFEDTASEFGLIGGTVTIHAASDESDIEYYKVYFVSHAGYQMDALGTVNATGEKVLKVPIGTPRPMPKYAAGLVAVSGNATGELPAQIGGRSPNVTVTDYVLPEGVPQAVKWNGDTDLREGIVAGKLLVTRAMDETTITHYNVYWSNASRARGPRLGRLAANGFMLPKCTGPTCSKIAPNVTESGRVFSRDSYGNRESATIKASGPATVRVTRFNTESSYDTLTIGERELSGSPALPVTLVLGEGPFDIRWTSDGSISGGEWTFELIQTGATAEYEVTATVPLGRGLEVVPANGKDELPEGAFADVVDYSNRMPPSPGFAPVALHFTDLDNGTGVVAGIAEVTPATGASAAAIAYYQLDLADEGGRPIGATLLGSRRSPRANADGDKPVFIRVDPIVLPPGASKLIARAGNGYGLSAGWASAQIVDLRAGTPSAAPTSVGVRQGGFSRNAVEARPDRIATEEPAEPWLSRPDLAEKRRVVWTAAQGVRASPHRAAAAGCYIMSSVAVPALGSGAALGAAFRKALEQTLLAHVPFVGAEGVIITRVLEKSVPATPSAAKMAPTAVVEFRLQPREGAPAKAADRIESRLILLSMGGASAKRFSHELLERLAAAGSALPVGTRLQVGAPQQVVPKRSSGRALSEVAQAAATDASSDPLAASQEGLEWFLLAAMVAGLAAAGRVVLAIVLVRRRRGQLVAGGDGLVAATLEDGIHALHFAK